MVSQLFCRNKNVSNKRLALVGLSFTVLGTLLVLYRYVSSVTPDRDVNGAMDIHSMDPVDAPFIFIGGHESTGTGLMRILLDAHPWIRCGAEPTVTLSLLNLRRTGDGSLKKRLLYAHILPDAYDIAVRSFIYEIIVNMGPDARLLCHKQPTSFIYLLYLHKIFPKAKFINMVRDGRGAIDSTIRRGFNSHYQKGKDEHAMSEWERLTRQILMDCQQVGREHCLSVRYEHLVMYPERTMRNVVAFLNVPWDPILLKHSTILDKLTDLTPLEPSTVQFKREIHTESLSIWYGKNSSLDHQFASDIHTRNTLLQELGYADLGLPPNYTLLPYDIPQI